MHFRCSLLLNCPFLRYNVVNYVIFNRSYSVRERLNIGILCNELTRNFQNPLYTATKHWGKKLGVNLFFFEGRQLLGRKYSDIQYNATFLLASEEVIDGYILHPIFTHISHEQIVRWCKNYSKKPKVSINKRITDLASCVMVDNYRGMRMMLEHLAIVHGYRRIAFVYGAENDDESRDRYRAYKDYMTQLELWNSEWVFKGGFESDSGIEAIKYIISTGIDFEAVAFSNDETAIAAQDYLHNVIPDYKYKFAITGFDDSPHSQFTIPSLTTVSQPFNDMARTSLELIIRMINGDQNRPTERLLPTKLALRKSCGCDNTEIFDTYSLKLFTSPFSIHENIESFSRDEFFNKLTIALDSLPVSHCFIALYDQSFVFEENASAPEASTLHYAYINNSRKEFDEPIQFKTSKLLPDSFLKYKNMPISVVQPLFYRDDHFGYVIFDGDHTKETDMDELRSTISTTLHTVILFEGLNQALGDKNRAVEKVSLLNEKLSSANKKLKEVSRSDELTQTYNRRGFYDAITERVSDNRLLMPITLFYADMDDLKIINDEFGHGAGDEAIALSAEILRQSFRHEDIIGRMGGDEFVVFTNGFTENDIEQLINRIEVKTNQVNVEKSLQYRLSISLGYQTVNDKSMDQVERAIQQADRMLYRVKREKKHNANIQ